MRLRYRVGWYLLILLGGSLAFTQARPFPGPDVQQIYLRLLPQIEKIPAFDHHAHPGFFDDADVDAMAAPPGSAALRERDTNPELVAAAKALFGYPYNDLSPEHAKWLVQKKAELKKSRGNQYFSDLLDKLNIERGVANRAMMADYLDPKRFPWVFFADSFMWPFNNQRETARNSDEQVYIPLQEKMLHRWMQQESVSKLPARFDDYLAFVTRTLEDNHKKGGSPYDRQAFWLASVKNVYLDTSESEILLYPSEFKHLLKQWLETFPDKITFGTDAFPYNETLGAEESYWLGVQSSRTARAAALAEMISEGEVSEAQALQLAHGYLHDNAVAIYEGKAH